MRLLVIEDERDLCEDIAKKLRLSGYEADICFDGEAALELLAVEKYDLVLLDLNLPKVDGMTVLRTLREHDQETGVLILSARSEISDKVDGLDAGRERLSVQTVPFRGTGSACAQSDAPPICAAGCMPAVRRADV